MGRFENESMREWVNLRMGHFENGSFRECVISRMDFENGSFWEGFILRMGISRMGHSEYGPSQKWVIFRMGHFTHGPFREWAILRIGHFAHGSFREWAISRMGNLEYGQFREWAISRMIISRMDHVSGKIFPMAHSWLKLKCFFILLNACFKQSYPYFGRGVKPRRGVSKVHSVDQSLPKNRTKMVKGGGFSALVGRRSFFRG